MSVERVGRGFAEEPHSKPCSFICTREASLRDVRQVRRRLQWDGPVSYKCTRIFSGWRDGMERHELNVPIVISIHTPRFRTGSLRLQSASINNERKIPLFAALDNYARTHPLCWVLTTADARNTFSEGYYDRATGMCVNLGPTACQQDPALASCRKDLSFVVLFRHHKRAPGADQS